MDNPEKFSSSKEVIAFLAESFPQCFSVEGDAKPLKIGIFQELAEALKEEQRLSKTLLRTSLRHYTNSWRYLHSVKEGSYRVDLNGDNGEVVEKQHADHAQQQLQESKQKVAERRKSQEQNDKAAKKSYKNKTKKPSKSTLNGTNVKKSKPNNNTKPQKLTEDDLKEGTEVTVKVGRSPMQAVIREVNKDGVQVLLQSGMQMKVPVDSLRLARSKRL